MKTFNEMTIMKNVKTYICMFLMIMGTCASAWGAGDYSVNITNNLTGCSAKAGNPTSFLNTSSSYVELHYIVASGKDGEHASISVKNGSTEIYVVDADYPCSWSQYDGSDYVLYLCYPKSWVGNNALTITITCCSPLAGKPTGMSSTPAATSATLSWGAVSGATSYTLYVTDYDNAWEYNVTGTSRTVTGLTAGTKYAWTVRAINECVDDDDYECATQEFTTTAAGSKYDITYYVPSCATAPANVVDHASGAYTLPNATSNPGLAIDGYTFVGWTSNSSYADGTSAPTPLYTDNVSLGSDMHLYAVYSKSQNVAASAITWSHYTEGTVTNGNYVISNGQYATGTGTNKVMDNEMASRGSRIAAKDITMSGSKITSEVTSVAWQFAKQGDYWTIYNPYAKKYVAATANEKEATLVSDVTDAALWTITKSSNTYNIISKLREDASETAKYLKYNSTADAWACYAQNSAIFLYKTDVNPFEGSTTYTINPQCATYSVTYNANGGTGTVPTDGTKYTQGATAIVLGNVNGLAKDGAAFAGWATSSSATVAAYHSGSELTIGTSDVTLYAVWSQMVSITYKDQGDVDCTAENIDDLPMEHVTGGGNTALVDGTKTNYHFRGWYYTSACDGDAVTEIPSARNTDLTLYAKWEAMYTDYRWKCPSATDVTFDPMGGTFLGGGTECVKQIEVGNNEPCCGNPEKTGYTFTGWYEGETDGKMVFATDGTMQGNTNYTDASGNWKSTDAEVTVYAHWTAIEYTITYENTKGATNNNPDTYTIESNITFTALPNVTGYTFAGWSPATISAGTTGNQTVTASWTVNQHSLTWDFAGGATTSEDGDYTHGTVEYGTTIIAPANPTKTGYTFNGWSPAFVAETTMPDENVTYTAQWTAKQYALTLEANYVADPAIAAQTATVTYNATGTGSWTKHSRTGYTLDGYYTDPTDGMMVISSSRVLEKNVAGYTDADGKWVRDEAVTLYAHWTINSFSVVWYDEAGNEFASTTVDYGGNVDAPVGNPTCDNGKVFIGWTTSKTDAIQDSKPTQTNFPANNIRGDRKFYPIFASRNGGKEDAEAIDNALTIDFEGAANVTSTHTAYGEGSAKMTIYGTGDSRNNETACVTTKNKIADLSKIVYDVKVDGGYTGIYYKIQYSENGSSWTTIADDQKCTSNNTWAIGKEVNMPAVTDVYVRIISKVTTLSGTNHLYIDNLKFYTKPRTWWYSDYSTNCNVAASATLTYAECDLAAHVASSIPENVTLPTPEKTGYVFKNWRCEQTGHKLNYNAGETYVLAHDVTLTAIWTAKHTITYKEGDAVYTGEWGSDPHPTEFVEGEGCTLVDAQKDCYTFGGWYREADCSGTKVTKIGTTVKTDEVLYAKFTQNKYTVSFNINSHGTKPTNQSVNCGEKATDPNTADVAGWHLEGWYTDNGTWANKWDFENDVVTEATALYAHWVSAIHTITCQTQVGVNGAIQTECISSSLADIAAGTSNVEVTLNESCIPEGYHLYSWTVTTSKGGSTGNTPDVENKKITITTMPDADVTVTAILAPEATVTGTVALTSAVGVNAGTAVDAITISASDITPVAKIRIKYRNNKTSEVWQGDARGNSAFRLKDATYNVADGNNTNIDVETVYNGSNTHSFTMVYSPKTENTMDDWTMIVELLGNEAGTTIYDTKELPLSGRSLPNTFVVATKYNGMWYALPNNMDAAGTYAPVLINVDEENKVAYGPATAGYGLNSYLSTNNLPLNFVGANNKCLWASSASEGEGTHIRNFADKTTAGSEPYAWILTTSDMESYTMSPLNTTRNLTYWNDRWGMFTSGNTEMHFYPLEEVTPMTVTPTTWGIGWVEVAASTNPGEVQLIINGDNETVTATATEEAGIYRLTDSRIGVATNSCREMAILKDGQQAIVKMPMIVASDKAATTPAAVWDGVGLTVESCKDCDIVVTDEATLSYTGSSAVSMGKMAVYAGARLEDANDKMTWDALDIRREGDVVGSARLNSANATRPVNFTWTLDDQNWYWFVLPMATTGSAVHYLDDSNAPMDVDWYLADYDGAHRVIHGDGGNWRDIEADGSAAKYNFVPGKGYIIGLADLRRGTKKTLVFPMTGYKENDTKNVTVYAYGATTGAAENRVGWNLVGDPFLEYYGTSANPFSALLVGEVNREDGTWTRSGTVPYVTIPINGGEDYYQQLITAADLSPFTSFFVQIGGDSDGQELSLAFDNSKRNKRSVVARAPQEISEPIIATLVLSNSNSQSDETSMVVWDNFSDTYEVGGDLVKMKGDNYRTSNRPTLYSLHASGELAFQATNEAGAARTNPLGYYTKLNGEHVFSLSESVDVSLFESIILVDNELNIRHNLLTGNYTFSAVAEENTTRFGVEIHLKKDAGIATGIFGATNAGDLTPKKVIYDNKVFIIVGERVYDSTGKRVNK